MIDIMDVKKYCNEPFVNVEIETNGIVRLCCGSWHPKSVGNLFENSLEEIWINEESQKVRNSIYDQSYSYCKLDICPKWQSNSLSEIKSRVRTLLPARVKFSFDNSCNLECPSCRTKKIQHLPGSKDYNNSMFILESIKTSYLKLGKNQDVIFVITGSGDPFGSDIFRNFLYDLDGNALPKLRLVFLTNGVMLTEKVIGKIKKIHNNIILMNISIDAFNPDTYAVVRKGGNLNQLKQNIEFMHNYKGFNHIKFCYSFVVQNKNFEEMLDFADWILGFNNATIRYTRLLPWEDMNLDFESENVFDSKHKNYSKLKEIVKKIYNKYGSSKIDYTNLPKEFFND